MAPRISHLHLFETRNNTSPYKRIWKSSYRLIHQNHQRNLSLFSLQLQLPPWSKATFVLWNVISSSSNNVPSSCRENRLLFSFGYTNSTMFSRHEFFHWSLSMTAGIESIATLAYVCLVPLQTHDVIRQTDKLSPTFFASTIALSHILRNLMCKWVLRILINLVIILSFLHLH